MVTAPTEDTRKAYYAWELPDDLVKALETAKPPASTAQFNHELEALPASNAAVCCN